MTACSQDFGIDKLASGLPLFCLSTSGEVVPASNGECSGGGSLVSQNTQVFNASSITRKKIDLILMIDNSPSMSEEQAKVKSGLIAAGNQYFNNPNIDLCIWLISSSRYAGRSSLSNSSLSTSVNQGELLGCSSTMSPLGLVSKIQTKIDQIGVNGDRFEQLGKSLITHITNKDNFSQVDASSSGGLPGSLQIMSEFRSDATKAMVFVTDENNYFGDSTYDSMPLSTIEEMNDYITSNQFLPGGLLSWDSAGQWLMDKNDLPAMTGVEYRATASLRTVLVPDTRLGIYEYLQSLMNLSKVMVLNFLKLDASGQPAPLQGGAGIAPSMGAENIFQLKERIGNGSVNADIDSNDAGYTSQFADLFTNSVSLASQFTLSKPAISGSSLKVRLLRGSSESDLIIGVDFTLSPDKKIIQLSANFAASLQNADRIKVISYF
jgi:hypothetical protein